MSPIHQAFVQLHIGLTIGATAAETIAAAAGSTSLSDGGAWMIGMAAIGATAAVGAGEWDMRRDALREETHHLVHLHRKFGLSILALLWVLAIWRWLGWGGASLPSPAYLVAIWLITALIGLHGWFGGELVYAHGAGVAPTDQGQTDAEAAKRPSRRLYAAVTRKGAGEPS